MGVNVGAVVTAVCIVIVAVGVGLYDFRAGIITFGLLGGAIGVWNLTQE